jgi:D,D-heptose 1,7-bisphosphate phosphatase
VFLDRDGVLNYDGGYTHRIEDLEWIPGAIETIRHMNDMGVLVFVITNQAGIAHGHYTFAEVDRFHAAMTADLARAGAHVDACYTCPFHPQAVVESYRHPDHPDRKPNPGMILKALAEWPIDRSRSILIGDHEPTSRRRGEPVYRDFYLRTAIFAASAKPRWIKFPALSQRANPIIPIEVRPDV